jgi:hypothetical protein
MVNDAANSHSSGINWSQVRVSCLQLQYTATRYVHVAAAEQTTEWQVKGEGGGGGSRIAVTADCCDEQQVTHAILPPIVDL